MQCHVCSCSEFILFDGVYFCKECSSQIEASRKEEAEQEKGFSKKSLLKGTTKEKDKKSKKEKLYGDWISAEGYNYIIYKQVSTLINLGASEKLKSTVLYIWSKYLEKCEIAFRRDYNASESIPRLSVFAKKRDLQVLYGSKVASYKRKQNTKYKKKLKKKEQSKEDTGISDGLTSDDNKEDILQVSKENMRLDAKDDMPPDSSVRDELSQETNLEIESDATSEGSLDKRKSEPTKFSSVTQKYTKTVGKRKILKDHNSANECIHNMTICKTLSFCYLGLLYTEDQLLLCDLLRLVKEGKVPFIDVTEIFPNSMQLQCNDQVYFTTFSTPSVGQISLTCAKLIEFLKLPGFKHRPLMPAVFRFLKDLNLPGSLMCTANLLYSKMIRKNEIWYKTKYIKDSFVSGIPKYDVEAMALIVVSLKLMLVLDGSFESEHSKTMEKVNILMNNQKMFVYDEWKKQMKLKEFLFMKNGCTYSDFSRLDALKVDEIIRKYPISRIKEYGDYANRVKPHDFMYSLVRKELKAHIETVSHQSDACAFSIPTSFPLKHDLDYYVNEGAAWKMFKESQMKDMTFLKKDFSSDFMFYRHTNGISEESEKLIYLLLSTLYESAEVITLNKMSSGCQNILKTSSQYWYKNIQASEFSVHTQLWKTKLPSSFVWLLELLCKYLQVSCENLYLEVLAVEKELFLHKNLPRT